MDGWILENNVIIELELALEWMDKLKIKYVTFTISYILITYIYYVYVCVHYSFSTHVKEIYFSNKLEYLSIVDAKLSPLLCYLSSPQSRTITRSYCFRM